MSDLLEWDEDDERAPDDRFTGRLVDRVARAAAGLTILLALAAFTALLGAAGWLQHADIGTRLRERACDASPLPALGLFIVGGALVTLVPRISRLRHHDAMLSIHLRSGLLTALAPALLLVASLPGTLGCKLAGDIAKWQTLGPALTGNGGVMLSVAAAVGVGVGLAHTLEVSGHVPGSRAHVDAPPTIVELAVQEAEALEREAELRRFRGVD